VNYSSGKSAAKLIQQESLEKLNGQAHTMKRIVACDEKPNAEMHCVKLVQQRSLEKRRTKIRSEAGWPDSGNEAEPQELWRS